MKRPKFIKNYKDSDGYVHSLRIYNNCVYYGNKKFKNIMEAKDNIDKKLKEIK